MCAQSRDRLIGIDLGGTNIRAAIVTPQGDILARSRRRTPTLPDGHIGLPADLVAAMADCARPLFESEGAVLGVGVGAGGQYNPRTGMLLGINTGHPAFVNVPIGGLLAAEFQLPVQIDNDVKAAAYAEWKLGAGQGCSDLICAAVGTGIGGAVIAGGRLLDGRSGLAGHFGQIPDALTGVQIESLAGGVPLGRRAVERGLLPAGETTEQLFERARAGSASAAAFIHSAGVQLGRVLAGLAHALDPERIIIGGSVGLQPEYVLAVNEGLAEALMARWQDLRVIPARLGTDAGQIGAALRLYDQLRSGA